MTADIILSSVPKEQAGAASAVSETAYELGSALGIALLGSVVTGSYRGFMVPDGVPAEAAAAARESLGGAAEAARQLPAEQGAALLRSAQASFTTGFGTAAGVAATVLFATAVAAWLMLKGQRLAGEPGASAGSSLSAPSPSGAASPPAGTRPSGATSPR